MVSNVFGLGVVQAAHLSHLSSFTASSAAAFVASSVSITSFMYETFSFLRRANPGLRRTVLDQVEAAELGPPQARSLLKSK